MSPTQGSPAEFVRRGLLKIDSERVLSVVDSLDLRASNKVSPVVGVPLRNLQQRRDVVAFATSAPIVAVRAVLELLAVGPLDQVVAALGESADDPSFEELAAALDAMIAEGITTDDVVALLTFAIGEGFPASAHCRRLLEEREGLELPTLGETTSASTLLLPKQVDPAVRDQRRARRELEKQKKKATVARPTRPVRVKRPHGSETKALTSGSDRSGVEVVISRRPVVLTPAESSRVNPHHPLAGSLIVVEVPFGEVDPVIPEQHAKERPALVVAANEVEVLVRGVYSSPSPERQLFQPWRRLGLNHVSYISDERVLVSLEVRPSPIGRLGDDEWNSLL